MVLTNIECWAHGGIDTGHVNTSASANDFDMRRSSNRGVDMFNPSAVSHISSNGYYGFSHVNNLVQGEQFNDNNNNNEDFVLQPITEASTPVDTGIAVRCKKRFYTGDSEFDSFLSEAEAGNVGGAAAAKRCRYDEGSDMAAQYCNDFFSLPVTQIRTQSCLMDVEDQQQQQRPHHQHHHHNQLQSQPQVFFSEAMAVDNTQNNGTQQQNVATAQVAEQQEQPQPQYQHHQQQHHHHHQHNQHYQGHLHRANRDASQLNTIN